MKKNIKQVEEIIHRLYELQASHIDSFRGEILPDLEQQSKDRDIETGKLMVSVNELAVSTKNGAEDDIKAMLLSINDSLITLLEQNKTLKLKVKEFRDGLKTSMKQISKGKKVISSYRSSTTGSSNPRVLSITN